MRRGLYLTVPVIILGVVMANAFFGQEMLGSIHDRSINRYSIYVHLQPGWESHPNNILYEVTNVWSGPLHSPTGGEPYTRVDPDDISTLVTYNQNQLQYQNSKPYVELRHEFSDCKTDWRPIPYRYAVDSARNWIETMQGVQTDGAGSVDDAYAAASRDDPYVWIFPNVPSDAYDADGQSAPPARSGYAQFIPVCTISEGPVTYDYSVMVNDPAVGLDAYFVRSEAEAAAYASGSNFAYYKQAGCSITGHNSFSSTCHGVTQGSGLLIIVPDGLDLSLTKVRVGLHERS